MKRSIEPDDKLSKTNQKTLKNQVKILSCKGRDSFILSGALRLHEQLNAHATRKVINKINFMF